jgi:hypothetical protein
MKKASYKLAFFISASLSPVHLFLICLDTLYSTVYIASNEQVVIQRNGDWMEIVVIAAIVAVGFGATATWLIATRLPVDWIERGQNEGRYGSLAEATFPDEQDPRRQQARTDTRRVRRSRVRASSPAMSFVRALRSRAGKACAAATRRRGKAAI